MCDGNPSYFLAGICGTGMSSLALFLKSRGAVVRGSDLVLAGPEVDRLVQNGIPVLSEEDGARSLTSRDVVIRSSAIHPENPVACVAQKLGCRVRHRTDVLAEVASEYFLIAVAGTHGKTSTTGMIGYLCSHLGYAPAIYVGGRILGFEDYFPPENGRCGGRPVMVMETDESDASFLKFHPDVAVITNIDRDHLGTYGGEFDRLIEAFQQFAQQCSERSGIVIGCGDDPNVRRILEAVPNHASYGYGQGNDVGLSYDRAANRAVLRAGGDSYGLQMEHGDETAYLNAVAAALACHAVQIPLPAALEALSQFPGMERRMQVLVEQGGVTVLSDHADHPTEIQATLRAVAVRYPGRRLFLVLQPHRYSRVQSCLTAYAPALAGVQHLALLSIFPAGEQCEDPAALNVSLRASIRARLGSALMEERDIEKLFSCLRAVLCPGDVVLFMGPGDIGRTALRFGRLLIGDKEIQ